MANISEVEDMLGIRKGISTALFFQDASLRSSTLPFSKLLYIKLLSVHSEYYEILKMEIVEALFKSLEASLSLGESQGYLLF